MKHYMKVVLTVILFILFVKVNLHGQIAVVDGNINEWNLTDDFYADMHRAGKTSKKVETKIYLRWECPEQIMYVLVLQAENTIPILTTDANDETFVKVDNVKMVDGGVGDDGTAPDFTWVETPFLGNSNYAKGWEASFPLIEGDYSFLVHNNVYDDGESQTASVEFEIELDCDEPLPVELTSFSVNVSNNIAQLNWETATEVNNYGFEIQRQSENSLWGKVGFVEGHGNSNSPKHYSFNDAVSHNGEYSYRLKQIDIDGQYEYSDVIETKLSVTNEFVLNKNYPNPFNPTTMITYSIPQDGIVVLSIYDVLGNEVAILENGYKAAGSYSNSFDATNLTSGIYFYTIRFGNYFDTNKMLLMK